jgi:hypothetical protein
MTAPALPKTLYDRAVAAGIKQITFAWSGGSDEGYLDVSFDAYPITELETLRNDIEEWASDAFDYSGAGEGNDYGDDYVYDLAAKTVSHSAWYTQPVYEDTLSLDLDVVEDENT